jgi:hypothetical protein
LVCSCRDADFSDDAIFFIRIDVSYFVSFRLIGWNDKSTICSLKFGIIFCEVLLEGVFDFITDVKGASCIVNVCGNEVVALFFDISEVLVVEHFGDGIELSFSSESREEVGVSECCVRANARSCIRSGSLKAETS